MVKTLRILSFVFLGIGLAAGIYSIASGKQLGMLYNWFPFMMSVYCSLLYHRMVHPEKLPKMTAKSSLIAAVAVYVLVFAVVMAIIVLS